MGGVGPCAGLIGVGQLYLGGQWLTDVLGTLALGTVCLLPCSPRRPPPHPGHYDRADQTIRRSDSIGEFEEPGWHVGPESDRAAERTSGYRGSRALGGLHRNRALTLTTPLHSRAILDGIGARREEATGEAQ